MFACTVAAVEDVLLHWGHPDCSIVREFLPPFASRSGATRSCVHNSSGAVTHSRGGRVLSWGHHLCSPAKKARQDPGGRAAIPHSGLCVCIHTCPSRAEMSGGSGSSQNGRWPQWSAVLSVGIWYLHSAASPLVDDEVIDGWLCGRVNQVFMRFYLWKKKRKKKLAIIFFLVKINFNKFK